MPASTPIRSLFTRAKPTQAVAGNGTVAAEPPNADQGAAAAESPRKRARRHARRARLHGYALVSVALFAVVIALAASNTARAKVSWVVGSSRVSLVWMVLAAAVVGWLLGLATAAWLHHRTRAPH
ncbi:MAG: hypothetical protein ABSC56_13175 [Solirubrobacteraceae bacterium]|jgi:uncharacterized integral membrane protein